LVTEWVDGKKLSDCNKDDINKLIAVGQECFLVQLLQVGVFHSDPHPGNLLKLNTPKDGAELCLLDFGLVARLEQKDMDTIVSAIIHLANRNYADLVDDFISLDILPQDCDRSKVVPLMDKALSPYVKGGGAKRYEEELKRMYGFDEDGVGAIGGFQSMTNDLLTVLNDIPFSIPPYFALIARAVVTLEGVALTGNPDYGLVTEAYPFVARKLLREDRPEIQRALADVLYGGGGYNSDGVQALSFTRLLSILNGALGNTAETEGGTFVDIDSVPDEGAAEPVELARYLLSEKAESLRGLLEKELEEGLDLLLRQSLRKSAALAFANAPRPRVPFSGTPIGPPLESLPAPFVLPPLVSTAQSAFDTADSGHDAASVGASASGEANGAGAAAGIFGAALASSRVVVTTPLNLVETIAPALTREEELYALSLTDLIAASLGEDAAVVARGDGLSEPEAVSRVVLGLLAGGDESIDGASVGGGGGARGVLDAVTSLLPVTARPPPRDAHAAADPAAEALEQLRHVAAGLTGDDRVMADATVAKLRDALLTRLETRLAVL